MDEALRAPLWKVLILPVIDPHSDRDYYRIMQRVARLLLDMVSAGVITDYAVFDAVAQMRYTEAVSTMDADILVGLPERPGLDILKPIYDDCVSRGYRPEGKPSGLAIGPCNSYPPSALSPQRRCEKPKLSRLRVSR
jgi:hypothetical protein